jgi:hypothetical protein
MNLKNGLILSILFNIGLIALIVFVKKDAHAQAQDFVKSAMERSNSQLRQAAEIQKNNIVLWELVLQIMEAEDKSIANVTRLAKAMRLPDRENEKAYLTVDATSLEGNKARRIGWEKYNILVTFDDKNQVLDINADDLLGKAAPVTAVVAEEEPAVEAAPAK